ncbi:CvpA family protein [Legionella israelensis]|uniref:CvpA family protein n=1 Tax=Legionella israelensis TaxID=454 RepID=UPI00117C73A8|nr:CvpA family protein [Legionella israelensis]QDP72785.1 CvpA family protein [Legionella israelensis]
MEWHWLDLVIIAVIALSVITGLFRGFVKEIIALCTWILAFWVAFTYSKDIDHMLPAFFQDQTARAIVSFLVLFFAVLLLGGIFNALLSFVLRRTGLSGTDRILGMGFGFIRGVFIVALVILAIKMSSLPYQQYSQDSELFAKFEPVVNMLYRFMPDFIKKIKSLDEQGMGIELIADDVNTHSRDHRITDTVYTS